MEITTNLIDLTERKISNTYGFEFYFNNTTAIKTKPIVLNSFLPFIKKRSKFKNLQGVFNLFFVRWAKIIHIENQYFTKKITNMWKIFVKMFVKCLVVTNKRLIFVTSNNN